MKPLNACPPAQPLERLSQPGVRSAHASVTALSFEAQSSDV